MKKIEAIFGNEETGLQWSWDRDKLVTNWCNSRNIKFKEFHTNGVIRKLKSRDNWKKQRDFRVHKAVIMPVTEIISPEGMYSDYIPEINELGLSPRPLIDRPKPGEKAAYMELNSFLDTHFGYLGKILVYILLNYF